WRAEDGIRDLIVTGVQTCALPIFAGAKTAAAKQNVGIIRELGDGVAKLEGLTDAMLNEMIDLGNGVTGLVLNLEETDVGVIILRSEERRVGKGWRSRGLHLGERNT